MDLQKTRAPDTSYFSISLYGSTDTTLSLLAHISALHIYNILSARDAWFFLFCNAICLFLFCRHCFHVPLTLHKEMERDMLSISTMTDFDLDMCFMKYQKSGVSYNVLTKHNGEDNDMSLIHAWPQLNTTFTAKKKKSKNHNEP